MMLRAVRGKDVPRGAEPFDILARPTETHREAFRLLGLRPQ